MNNISILTILKNNNYNNLKIIFNIIKNQTYKNINQWIIIYDNNIINLNNIKELFINNDLINIIEYVNINLIKDSNYEKILLNNIKIENNIIIFMKINNYYSNNYVEKCVYNFNNTDISHLYIDNIIYYDLILNNTFNITNYNKLIGFKKIYDINKFLIINNNKLIIKILNDNNKKREKCVLSLITKIDNFEQINNDNIIDNYYLSLYNDLNNNNFQHDIIYMTGPGGIFWDPTDAKLGGSEQAIVNLSENWIKLNKTVVVYGNFKKKIINNNVKYDFWYNFPFNQKINVLIIWRALGINLLMNFNLNVNKIIIDFHDNFSYTLSNLNQQLMFNLFDKVDKFNFKSLYHLKCFEQYVLTSNYINNTNKYNIIMNGLRIDNFKNNNNNYIRNPFRFCYCSCYTRGLEIILEKIWPIIYNKEPKAELHIYYGMDYVFDEKYKLKINLLMSQCGVMDHGRQPMDMIIREKYLSTFHIYLNNSIAEIDCISIRESLITGCIPIISTFGVFNERHGIQYNFDISDKNCNNIANDIIDKMYDFNFINNSREQLLKSSTIISWYDIAKEWINKSIDN